MYVVHFITYDFNLRTYCKNVVKTLNPPFSKSCILLDKLSAIYEWTFILVPHDLPFESNLNVKLLKYIVHWFNRLIELNIHLIEYK